MQEKFKYKKKLRDLRVEIFSKIWKNYINDKITLALKSQ
jgi:hypothetical protein